ncbi:hypothetical protein [Streptococcus parasanguinis]|uniref:hypothetical protein n=1 Tax=Streptococcus parasanguinis TaxID=1318 RepID=UPI0012DA0CBA|nr:hypothetical protein [Streptococcus parasanguinis]
MKRELIEDSIQKYQDLLDDEEYFQRLRNFFPRTAIQQRKEWIRKRIKALKEDLKNADE